MTSGLEPYRTLQSLTRQMLEAARTGEWAHLAELEQQCAQLRDLLSHQPSGLPSVSPAENIELTGLIKEILVCHENILTYVLPRQKDMKQMLDSFSTTQRLQHSYGVPASTDPLP